MQRIAVTGIINGTVTVKVFNRISCKQDISLKRLALYK